MKRNKEMEKIGLFALICVLALLLVGCTKNVKTTPLEDSSEVIFKNPEVQNNTPEPAKQDAKLSNAICMRTDIFMWKAT